MTPSRPPEPATRRPGVPAVVVGYQATLTPDQSVRLRDPAQFPDISTRDGVVRRVDAGVVVQWRGMDGESTHPAGDLEGIDGNDT